MSNILVEKLDTFTGHRDCVYAISNGNSENIFFTGAADGMVVKWDLNEPNEGKVVAQTKGSVYALYFDEENNQLLIGENFHGIHIIDLQTDTQIKSIKLTESAIFDIKIVNSQILVATGDGKVLVYNQLTGDLEKILNESSQSARCIAIGETEIAVGYSDFKIRIFSKLDFQLLKTIDAHQNSVFCLAYHPLTQDLISGSRDAHLKIWDSANNYELKKSIVAHLFAINHIAFSPDCEWFATCSMDKSVKVWDAKEYQLLKVIDKSRHAGHATSINKLLWITKGQLLASVSDDRSISIWKLTNNKKYLK